MCGARRIYIVAYTAKNVNRTPGIVAAGRAYFRRSSRRGPPLPALILNREDGMIIGNRTPCGAGYAGRGGTARRYGSIAELYDHPEIYAERWSERSAEAYRRHYRAALEGARIQSILDCSTGTGNPTYCLADLGYDICGSGLSETMLRQAEANARAQRALPPDRALRRAL